MKDFRFFVPTEVVFGKGAEDKTGELAAKYGKKALLVYGGGNAEEVERILRRARG